ncbi:MAG: gliding motility-associated C-terminal domain-containing protein [Cyclobacteriaceae bacterium]|nr:gliding motility-associated C-terminal domain-containing protein [Cyclobacteriaceae bacterium]
MLIFEGSLLAQNSIYGRFEVDYASGCAPLKVVISETDTFSTETVRQYDFEGDGVFVGFEPTEEVTHTFSQPGSYVIVQVINVDIVPKTDTLFLEVYSSTDPDFAVLTCENHGAAIKIEPDQYQQYRIFYTPADSLTINQGEEAPPYTYPAGSHSVVVKGLFIDGKDNCGMKSQNFTTIPNLVPATLNEMRLINRDQDQGAVILSYALASNVIYRVEMAEDFPAGFEVVDFLPGNSTSYTLHSIDTENSLPIVRISAYDACLERLIHSDTVSAIRIDGLAENDRNRLSWEVYPLKFDNYEIFRDNAPEAVIAAENRREYIDDDVECFTEYCYAMVYTNSNGAKSYSDTACITAIKIYFPPAIRNTTVSVDDQEIDLEWTPPGTAIPVSYFIQKKIDEDIYATLDTVLTNQFADLDSDAGSGSQCYRISYLDECLNRSNLGDLACSIYLVLEDNQSLSWNDYAGWRNGVQQYILEVYQEDGTLEEEISMGTGNLYEIADYNSRQKMHYRIRAESNDDPALIALSNRVIKEIEPVLWIPNAFTPNSDGLNDTFKPEGTLMQEFSMKIFNRNGSLLFETVDQENGWDGFYDGEEMPFNTYIYIIEAVDNRGKSYNQTGKVLLMRE